MFGNQKIKSRTRGVADKYQKSSSAISSNTGEQAVWTKKPKGGKVFKDNRRIREHKEAEKDDLWMWN